MLFDTRYTFHEQKEHLTITKLLKTLRDDRLFNGQRKVDDRRFYYEQPHIIEQRWAYLCKMKQNRIDKKPVDQTWANAHDGKNLAWVEDDTVTGVLWGELDAHPVRVSVLFFSEREVRWVGSPTPLSSSNPRITQSITMTK